MARLPSRIGTFRQLEILLAVYSQGSITSASKSLFLTQPTVSMQLKKLSEAVGLPLYDQVGRKLVFTQAGLEIVNTAREVLGCLERLEMKLSDMQGLKTGSLKIAVANTAKYFIPHLLGDFLQHYPNIDVDFLVGNRQQILALMERGEEDFYVISHPPDNLDIQLHEFLSNPLVAIVQEGHPLTKRENISLKEFIKEPFLIRESGSGTRYAIDNHLREFGLTANIRMNVASNEAIKHSVMSGLGVTILSSHTLAFGGSTGLTKLEVEGLPIMTKWYLGQLESKEHSIVARTFLDYVQTHGKRSVEQQFNLPSVD